MVRLIIADDFTGSNDAGVQLVNKGLTVNVVFDWQNADLANSFTLNHGQDDNNAVIVVNSETRSTSVIETKARIKKVLENFSHFRPIYKKIDSTLRGNIGTEIETLLDHSEYQAALVIPAFPKMNRIVKNGLCYVNGVELQNTEFATDPKTPVLSSNVKNNIDQQTRLLSAQINLETLRNNQLKQTIENLISAGYKILIVDSETDNDLQLILGQIKPLLDKLLLVGSAGLLDFMPKAKKENKQPKTKTSNAPLLVIAGSMSEMTQQQISYAMENGGSNWRLFTINIIDLLYHSISHQLTPYQTEIQASLDSGHHCIVRTCASYRDRFAIDLHCQHYNLSRIELGEKIATALGQLVNQLKFDNLFLTGGDVAISVAKSLGAKGFTIEGEVCHGVPYGRLISQPPLPYRVFTKAGGFGAKNILLKSLAFI